MEIYINGVLLEEKKKHKNVYQYYLENGDILKTKDVSFFVVICEECRNKIELLNYPTTNNNIFLCKSCRQMGEKNPCYSRNHTEEWKKQKSINSKGKKNPMYNKSVYDTWVDKYDEEIANDKLLKFKNKMSSVTKGDNNGMYGKTYYEIWVEKYGKNIANKKNKELKDKHREWLLGNKPHHQKMIENSHKKRYRKTSIEIEIENYLIENNINYKYNHIDKYQYDFLLKDYGIIIEAQGDYWHGNPLYYSDTDKNLKPLNETQKYKQKLDILKNNYIKNTYKIIYIWETEIKNKKYKTILWNLLKLNQSKK